MLVDAALIFGAALVVRGATALLVPNPGYMDAYYHYHVAQNLLAGRGLTADVLWNYLAPAESLPVPSHAYWQPLTALLAAAGGIVLGGGFRAAQAGFVLLAAAACVLAYLFARATWGTRRYGWIVGLLTVFSGVYFPYWVTTDSFTPSAVLGGACLLLLGRGQSPRGWGLAGVAAGVALWARPESLLLPPVAAVYAFWPGEGVPRPPGHAVRDLLAFFTGFLLPAAPWAARNWLLWETPLPPGGGAVLFLREYDELFSYLQRPDLGTFGAGGVVAALAARARALAANLAAIGQPVLLFLLPATAWGLWQVRARATARPWLLYLIGVYLLTSAALPWPGVRGGFFHAASPVVPLVFGATLAGVDAAVGWAAKARHWHRRSAQRVFTTTLVGVGVAASCYFLVLQTGRWEARYQGYAAVAAWLDARAPLEARVMVVDPPGFHYASGRQAIVIPNDGNAALLLAAQHFGVEYLLLERASPRYLASLYDGRTRVDGLGLVGRVGDVQVYQILLPDQPLFAAAEDDPCVCQG